MAITGRQLGDLTLARAVEMVMPFDRQAFFPDTAPEDWAPYEAWLKPHAMDPQTSEVLFTVQSFVVRTSHHTILVDTCVGNHKERSRPMWQSPLYCPPCPGAGQASDGRRRESSDLRWPVAGRCPDRL